LRIAYNISANSAPRYSMAGTKPGGTGASRRAGLA
jgi:hypothetical protein